MLALPGGAYVYQGEELGLPEVSDLPDAVRQDPSFHRSSGANPGRDGCRVPLPWSGDEPSFGFGPSRYSWLPQPVDWAELTVSRQASDASSMLTLYRSALRLRRELPGLGDGELTWVDGGEWLLVFRREPGFVCVVNVGDEPATVRDEVRAGAPLVLSSGPIDAAGALDGATAVWYAAG